jgi:hypothetical protein
MFSVSNKDDVENRLQDLYSELADVSIVLEQVIYMHGCEDNVAEIRKYKIERQLERIRGECG